MVAYDDAGFWLAWKQSAFEEAVTDGNAAKGLLQAERESTALLSKARAAAVEVSNAQVFLFVMLTQPAFVSGTCGYIWVHQGTSVHSVTPRKAT